jgi:hypothetical protein
VKNSIAVHAALMSLPHEHAIGYRRVVSQGSCLVLSLATASIATLIFLKLSWEKLGLQLALLSRANIYRLSRSNHRH